MSFFNRQIVLATLMGTTMLALPFSLFVGAAMAQTAAPMTAEAVSPKMESIEQRITSLHDSLKITAGEEGTWTAVAATMRENAVAMQKLTAAKSTQEQQGMTATDDLQTYTNFAQAHLEGLKKLSSSFGTLYNSMPADQQKVADQVFRDFGHKGSAASK